MKNFHKPLSLYERRDECKNQELKQSSTTPDPEHKIGKLKQHKKTQESHREKHDTITKENMNFNINNKEGLQTNHRQKDQWWATIFNPKLDVEQIYLTVKGDGNIENK